MPSPEEVERDKGLYFLLSSLPPVQRNWTEFLSSFLSLSLPIPHHHQGKPQSTCKGESILLNMYLPVSGSFHALPCPRATSRRDNMYSDLDWHLVKVSLIIVVIPLLQLIGIVHVIYMSGG